MSRPVVERPERNFCLQSRNFCFFFPSFLEKWFTWWDLCNCILYIYIYIYIYLGVFNLTWIFFSTEFAFFLAGEKTQFIESIPWVQCASGNVDIKKYDMVLDLIYLNSLIEHFKLPSQKGMKNSGCKKRFLDMSFHAVCFSSPPALPQFHTHLESTKNLIIQQNWVNFQGEPLWKL